MNYKMLVSAILSAIFFCFASLYSADPLVKFYLNDGTTKQYNLSEIDSLGVIDKQNNCIMRIHYDDSLIAYYPTEIIGSIKFDKDDIQRDILNVYIFSYPKPYKLSSIDSLIFYIDQWQPLTIGSQVWMLKNLNVDHYRNGDSIPDEQHATHWYLLTSGAWCYYNYDSAIGAIYGKLYNWYAVNDPRGLAPVGWHVASDGEWKELDKCLGMTQAEADKEDWRGTDEGGNLKNTGTKEGGDGLWYYPNDGATNSSGFSALPGGVRLTQGSFSSMGDLCYWWSSTEVAATYALIRYLSYSSAAVGRSFSSKTYGFSVRCVKDGK